MPSSSLCYSAVFVFLTTLAGSVAAQDVIVGDDLTNKSSETDIIPNTDDSIMEPAGIRIGGGQDRKPPPRQQISGDLQLQVTGARARYRVGEAISFNVRGNQEFFLWAYARDNSGDSVLLVPSPSQEGNKYPGGRTFRLPNPGLEFYADAPGPHQIVLVASTYWLDMNSWLRRHARAQSNYWVADTQAFEAEMESKGVRIGKPGGTPRPPRQNSKPRRQDVVVQQISFDVVR